MIARTRLTPPRAAASHVSRAPLLRFLERGQRRALTLVQAPAGFGKTTLLAEWRRQLVEEEQPVAWLTVDGDDNDPTQFLQSLIVALREAIGQDCAAAQQLPHPGRASDKGTLVSLINALDTLPTRIALVLDDYERIQSPIAHELISDLLLNGPHNLHIFIATRQEPPLPLSWLRAHDQIVEVDARSLRFDEADTRRFLAGVLDAPLRADELRLLHEVTEGWVAGLLIVAISMQDLAQPATLLRTRPGKLRGISDYLSENVLPRIEPALADFLLRTSILERMNAELCACVTGDAGAAAKLAELQRLNLFTQALDDEGVWFRYHGLFADFLRHRLQQTLPHEHERLHRRASGWLADNGLWQDAVRHALAAGDGERAVAWIEAQAMPEVERGNMHTVLLWQRRLPETALRSSMPLLLALAWAHTLTTRIASANDLLELIERGIGADDAALRCELTAIRSVLAAFSDRPMVALGLATRCLADLAGADFAHRPMPWVDAVVRNVVTYGAERIGDLRLARSAQKGSRPLHSYLFSDTYRHCMLGACDLHEGRLHAAADALRHALATAEQDTGRRSAAAALPACFLAAIHYEWNQLDRAEQLLADRTDIIDESCMMDAVLMSHQVLVGIHAQRREFDEAHRILDRAEALAEQNGWPRLLCLYIDRRIRLWRQQGDAAAAERTLERLRQTVAHTPPLDDPTTQAEIQRCLRLAEARALLHRSRHTAAGALLEGIVESDRRHGHLLNVATPRLLLAAARHGSGESAAGVELLTGLMEEGAAASLTRSFLDEVQLIAPVLETCINTTRLDDTLRVRARQLLHARRDTSVGQGNRTDSAPAASLSQRELAILKLVADGCTNKHIAKQLHITPATVKWHLKNIFAKLDVGSRTLAVHRAHALALISPI